MIGNSDTHWGIIIACFFIKNTYINLSLSHTFKLSFFTESPFT
ncbi:hypothetical protein VIBHAR_05978 [Vibrio campbellii ATCC BAA-1116]|uniref:Uncharacterized protein n=1 Tax=Vibrio campbellii (strain ATCC BAA-1116) TaxID=2902295 RepID=A7N5B3_VIBC1|nr:hypothetical protein VIBHAR_05978 [Vibrio campbellii ATCC BAA-1116]